MAESFDTHEAYLELTKSNCFTPEQAEKLVVLVKGAIVAKVATKSSLENPEKKLNSDIKVLEERLILKFEALEERLILKIEALEKSILDQMKTLKCELTRFAVYAVGIGVCLNKALDYLLPF